MPEPADDRDPFELVASEFIERQRRGENPSVDEYAQRYPGMADEIRDLFPTILEAERMKGSTEPLPFGVPVLDTPRIERLGDFRITREIGRGGMGIVYEAEQESLGRRVAIKVLPRQALLDVKHLRRFRREARIAAGLHHTNIAEIFGVGEQDGLHYFVMQYIDGLGIDRILAARAEAGATAPSRMTNDGMTNDESDPSSESRDASPHSSFAIRHSSLGQLALLASGPLGPAYWRQVATIGCQVADALHYSHSQGVLHRDVKPSNLLVDPQGRVWVTDFGLAKALRSDDITVTGEIAGTWRYMAPEQLEGRADARSDVYGLGLTLCELLTFRPAFDEKDRSKLIRRVAEGHPTRPRSLNPRIPRDLETIVLKATARDPGHRYATAEALGNDLQRFLDDQPILARRASSFERLWRWSRRNKAVAALAGTTVLLILLVAAVAVAGYLSTRRALQEAKANAEVATDAIDRIFERFSPRSVVASPGLIVDNVEGSTVDVQVEPVLSREAAALLEDILPFYERLARQTPDAAALRRKVADANRRVGDIRQRLGQHDQAAAAYQHAIALYEGLSTSAGESSDPRVEMAKTYNELGRLCQTSDRTQEARDAHLRALHILDGAPAGPTPTPEFHLELARTHYFLALTAPPGSPAEAVRRIETAIATLAPLREADPANTQYRHLLGLCYRQQSHAVGQSQPEAARVALDKATETLRQLASDFPRVQDYQYDLSETYAAVDPLRPGPGPYAPHIMEERLRQALGLAASLAQRRPHIPRYTMAQALFSHRLALLLEVGGGLDEAERLHTAAIELQRSLASQLPETLYHKVRLGEFANDLARLLLLRRRPAEARPLLEENIALLTPALKGNQEPWVLHALLARSYGALEAAWRDLGNEPAAAQARGKAKEHREAMRSSGTRGSDSESDQKTGG